MKYLPFHKPNLPSSTSAEVKQVLDSGWITSGEKVRLLEAAVAKLVGAKYAVAVSSGTAALHLAYLAAGIGPGDEVIVPSYTFCSTINMLVHVGAKPIFCDIEENTLCLDPIDVEKRITQKTVAIVAVHFAGMSAEMTKINAIAKKHNLKVIEDAAHALLTKFKGEYIGSGRNLVCFSFYATKNLTTAEGGMVICPTKRIADDIRMMSLHGMTKGGWKRYSQKGSWRYEIVKPGFKYNLSDVHASIGLAQIPGITGAHEKRLRYARMYKALLSKNPHIILPAEPKESRSEHSWHLFTIRIKPSAKISRDHLIDALKKSGIGTSVHFIPNHLQPYYKKSVSNTGKLPVTELVFSQALSLPFYERLSERDIKHICQQVNKLTHA